MSTTTNTTTATNKNIRFAANRILIPRASMVAFDEIMRSDARFTALRGTMNFRRHGISVESVVLNRETRHALLDAVDAATANCPALRTARRRMYASFERTDARYWALAATNPAAGFKLGLRARTTANVGPTGRPVAA